MEIDIDLINVMKFLIFFNLKIWLLANAITIGSAFDETNKGCYLDTNGKLCTFLCWVVDFKVLVVENRNLFSFSNLKALSSRTEYTYSYFK